MQNLQPMKPALVILPAKPRTPRQSGRPVGSRGPACSDPADPPEERVALIPAHELASALASLDRSMITAAAQVSRSHPEARESCLAAFAESRSQLEVLTAKTGSPEIGPNQLGAVGRAIAAHAALGVVSATLVRTKLQRVLDCLSADGLTTAQLQRAKGQLGTLLAQLAQVGAGRALSRKVSKR